MHCLLFNLHPGAAGEGKHTAPLQERAKQFTANMDKTNLNKKIPKPRPFYIHCIALYFSGYSFLFHDKKQKKQKQKIVINSFPLMAP